MITMTVAGHIADIQLNRPEKLNAISPDMLKQLDEIITQIEDNTYIRVVFVTGAGEKAFSVGADIHYWTELDPTDMWRSWIREGHRVFDRLANLRQPTISVLNGYTLGGGLELALATDIRLAGDQIQLGQPEVKLATIPGWGGTHRLPALIGVGRAKQMIFSGESISSQQASEWGLVNEVHPADSLMSRAQELAGQIAKNAPLAVQFAKQALDASQYQSNAMIIEAFGGALSATTDDAKEGKSAFQEKRSPSFKGQ